MCKHVTFYKNEDDMRLMAAYVGALEFNGTKYVISNHMDKILIEVVNS